MKNSQKMTALYDGYVLFFFLYINFVLINYINMLLFAVVGIFYKKKKKKRPHFMTVMSLNLSGKEQSAVER